MKVDNLKDFQKLVTVCRKMGISDFKGDGFEFHLGPKPQAPRKLAPMTDPLAHASITVNPALLGDDPVAAKAAYDAGQQPSGDVAADVVATPDALTEEQQMFYSVAGEESQG